MSEFFEKCKEGFLFYNNPQPLAEGESEFINRELSWMEFNERVLEEARDKNNPLYERLNFLAITCSNLDEFFSIRVATLVDLVSAGGQKKDPAGLSPKKQLELLMERNQEFFKKQYSTYNRQIIPALEKEGIYLFKTDDLNKEQKDALAENFRKQVFPVLTPIAVDASRPLPLLDSKRLNLLVQFKDVPKGLVEKSQDNGQSFAIVQIPGNLPRLIKVPFTEENVHAFIFLEDLVELFVGELFNNTEILSADSFRIMRNADFELDEDEIQDLLQEIESQVKLRQRGDVIRLELRQDASAKTVKILQELLKVPEQQIFRVQGPIDLLFFFSLPSLLPRPELRYKAFSPQPVPAFENAKDPFELIRKRDLFLHHPYDSFDPVVQMVQKAAKDPKVLAIKQTLYRVSGNSPIVAALAEAANQGKQVLVLVELKARFDEENNIHWARELERAGCHVIYGLKGLKTHSKITMIVREEEEGLRRYVHIGTGNYNDKTAKIYTDIGIWSANELLGEDATNFFNMISGYSIPDRWHQLVPAPLWLRKDFLYRIEREKENAEKGLKAMIVAKFNSLVDPEIIQALYAASQAGVLIRLIVRGISCLRPGVAGLSENVEVRSLVGRYLEHSRIFYFYNNGEEDLLIGSADWMPRNLDRRVELVCPVRDEACRERIFEILRLELEDNLRARIEQPDGLYQRVDKRGKVALDSQEALCEIALRQAGSHQKARVGDLRFEPAIPHEIE